MKQLGFPDYSHPNSDPDSLGCAELPRTITTTTTTEAGSDPAEVVAIADATGGEPTPAGHYLW